MRKYVRLRSKAEERTRAVIVDAALISDSPVTAWQIDPSLVQCACGKSGENPGTVTFCSSRLNSGIPYQASSSGVNYVRNMRKAYEGRRHLGNALHQE